MSTATLRSVSVSVMTPINPDSPLQRITAATYQGRRIVIELHPKYVKIYRQGRRRSDAVNVPYDVIYESGIKMEVRREN